MWHKAEALLSHRIFLCLLSARSLPLPDRTVILPRYHFNRFSCSSRNTTLLLWAETLTPDISYFVVSMPAADFGSSNRQPRSVHCSPVPPSSDAGSCTHIPGMHSLKYFLQIKYDNLGTGSPYINSHQAFFHRRYPSLNPLSIRQTSESTACCSSSPSPVISTCVCLLSVPGPAA